MHMGIAISVQAWGTGSRRVFIHRGDADQCSQFTPRGSRCAALLHLIKPAQETQAASRRLRRVQTGSDAGVVVVDLRCLGDRLQQLVVRYGRVEGQELADHLEVKTHTQKSENVSQNVLRRILTTTTTTTTLSVQTQR